uniref:Uncharacterized protein n=1 Tax=Arundo donax TaxID=35708 RepID=A0A0A9FZJ4_ARUDO
MNPESAIMIALFWQHPVGVRAYNFAVFFSGASP